MREPRKSRMEGWTQSRGLARKIYRKIRKPRLGPNGEIKECRLMDWNEAHDLTLRLAKKVREEYKPDIIIAVERGGYSPARQVADYLRVREVPSLNAKHPAYEDKAVKVKIAKTSLDIKNKKVLVVDDISDTGESLKSITQYLKKLEPKELKTATLHFREKSKFEPDYYTEKLKHEKWVVYPWELHEDLSKFVHEITADWKTTAQIRRELKKERGIKGKKKSVLDLLKLMEEDGILKSGEDFGETYWKRNKQKLEM